MSPKGDWIKVINNAFNLHAGIDHTDSKERTHTGQAASMSCRGLHFECCYAYVNELPAQKVPSD